GKDDVAFNLARFNPVVNRLLPGPVLGVQTRVDDQPARAEECRVELPEQAFEVAVVPAGFRSQPFSIQTPALTSCRDSTESANLPKPREIFVLNSQRVI